MTLVLLVAALAIAVVLLSGGARHLVQLRFRALRLLAAAAVVQLAMFAFAPGGAVRVAAGICIVLLVGLFLAGNATLAGIPLIAAGFVANLVVILANGAMPVSVAAAQGAGVSANDLGLDEDLLREPLTSDSRLAVLGDAIPVAIPWSPQVVSPGDVLVAAGVALVLILGSRTQERESRTTAWDSESTTRGSYS